MTDNETRMHNIFGEPAPYDRQAPGIECRCPSGYPITTFRDGGPMREHHRNLCGLPNEDAGTPANEESEEA